MNLLRFRPGHRVPAATAAVALTASSLLAGGAPAAAAPAVANTDRGLFGRQDPTYDGVYRQGLAITGLVAVGRRPPRPAVRWLLRQQCANGAFLSYRADPSRRCPAPDPQAFTGPDSNSTAMAAMALRAAGNRRAANAATRYLRTMQNRDGGYAFYRGGESDVNSTGLVLAALTSLRQTAGLRHDVRAARGYLRRAQLRCDARAADRGLLAYRPGTPVANLLASAQGGLGQVTSLPVRPGRVAGQRLTPRLRCRDGRQVAAATVRDTLLDGLARALVRGEGLLPNAFGPGTDPSASAQATLALAAAGRAPAVVRLGVRAQRRGASSYTGARANPDAGALGTLLLLAGAVRADARDFGGVDLVRKLRGAQR